MEQGIPALHRYQSVQYYPFPVQPGCSLILTSDPWSYLYAHLKKTLPNTRGKNRCCIERALYYAELASEFYIASEATNLPAKGTLAYYGMLNLVKCFISSNGIELEKDWEHHGFTIPLGNKREITVKKVNSGVSIFQEFSKLLGKQVKNEETLTLKNVYSNIPEIHEITFSLGHLPWTKRKYLPIRIDYLVNGEKNKVFTEISYEKKNEERVDTIKFYKGQRNSYFKSPRECKGKTIFRSTRRKKVNHSNWPRIYSNIQAEYSKFDIVSILTRSGYKHYCDLKPGSYHHLAYILMLMFYIGSVARYRPTETEGLLQSDVRPIISEAVETLPRQFLYQLTSYSTKSVCVVPQARL